MPASPPPNPALRTAGYSPDLETAWRFTQKPYLTPFSIEYAFFLPKPLLNASVGAKAFSSQQNKDEAGTILTKVFGIIKNP